MSEGSKFRYTPPSEEGYSGNDEVSLPRRRRIQELLPQETQEVRIADLDGTDLFLSRISDKHAANIFARLAAKGKPAFPTEELDGYDPNL